jgi:hypothetical protein
MGSMTGVGIAEIAEHRATSPGSAKQRLTTDQPRSRKSLWEWKVLKPTPNWDDWDRTGWMTGVGIEIAEHR